MTKPSTTDKFVIQRKTDERYWFGRNSDGDAIHGKSNVLALQFNDANLAAQYVLEAVATTHDINDYEVKPLVRKILTPSQVTDNIAIFHYRKALVEIASGAITDIPTFCTNVLKMNRRGKKDDR